MPILGDLVGRAAVTVPEISRGAIALRQCGASATQIAARTGAAYPTVNNWLKGHRKPGPDLKVMLERFYAISAPWWDEPASVSTNPGQGGLLDKVLQPVAPVAQVEARRQADSVQVSNPGGGTVDLRSEAQALVEQIRKFRYEAEHDAIATPTERAKLLGVASSHLVKLFTLTGEVDNIPIGRILASPAWRKIRASLEGALAEHPEALRAVVAALETVDT